MKLTARHQKILDAASRGGSTTVNATFSRHVNDLEVAGHVNATVRCYTTPEGREAAEYTVTPREAR